MNHFLLKIPIFLLSLSAGISLFSQGDPSINLNAEKLSKDLQLKRNHFELNKHFYPQVSKNHQAEAPKSEIPVDFVQFSHSTPLGPVFILPGSKMPMLKPGVLNQAMPGAFSNDTMFLPRQGGMPNGLQPHSLRFVKPSMP